VSEIRSTPIDPSREMSACAADAPRPIPSSAPASATSRSIRCSTAVEPAPSRACQTTSTVSGLRSGKRSCSSSAAARDSLPGVE